MIRVVSVIHVLVVLFYDVRFHGAVAVATKISFCWWWVHVSQHVNFSSFWTNAVKPPLVLTLTSSLFNFSCFGPKSQDISFLLGRTVPHEFILRLLKSSKSLGDEKKLSINILCPKPSNLQVIYLTVGVLQSCHQLQSVSLYPSTHLHHMYTLIHCRVCNIWCRNIFFSLECTAWR